MMKRVSVIKNRGEISRKAQSNGKQKTLWREWKNIFSLCYPITGHVEKKGMNHLSKIQAGFEIFPFHTVNNKTQKCDHIIVSKLYKLQEILLQLVANLGNKSEWPSAVALHFSRHHYHLEGLLKYRCLGPAPGFLIQYILGKT